MMPDTIYAYIKEEEQNYETEEKQIGDNWSWNMRSHVQLLFHLAHGVFYTGENNWLRAFKNIMRPLLNLANWTEDVEVKDVELFIEDENARGLSFLIKKYHDEVYTREHDLDKLFDEITESDNLYGGVVVQKGVHMPEVLALNSLAFCDQTDLLGAPVGFKHYFSPSKLRSMSSVGWGDTSKGATTTLDQLVTLATFDKEAAGSLSERKNKTPGKQIEVYIVKGTLPERYLKDGGSDDLVDQVQVVAFYTDKEKKKVGVTLYRAKDDGTSLKFYASEEVYGRALGYGAGESFLHPQVWTNFLTIHKTQMLQAGAKTPLVTDDPNFTNKNKINEMENNEVATIEEGKTIVPIQTVSAANVQLYERAVDEWYEQGQLAGSAFDPLMGKEASSGSTFRGQERVVAQGSGLHERRRGQRAKFFEEIYRDWIIPDMKRHITEDTKFLATLSLNEMTWVADQLATNQVNRRIIDGMLKGKLMTQPERDLATQIFKSSFLKTGNKQPLKILKEEMEDIETRLGINIVGKQKDLKQLSDKYLSIIQSALANPQLFVQAMQIPALSKSLSNILEYSGVEQSDFVSLLSMSAQPQPPAQQSQPQAAPQAAAPLALAPDQATAA
jgi:hypothetical protein